MFNVPRKIIEVDLEELESRFIALYLDRLAELEDNLKKEGLCQNETA